MRPDHLTELLAEPLNEIAPPGFRVVAGDGVLGYDPDAGFYPFGRAATDICVNFHSDEPLAGRSGALGMRAGPGESWP